MRQAQKKKKRRAMKGKIRKKINSLRDIPGVYLMKDGKGKVIYIGKAMSLKKRVGSYFHSQGFDAKTLVLVNKISDFDIIPAASEAEALILENMLIKKYQPKYNTDLKDGKSYPFVKLTSDKFPSLQVVREPKDDKSVYYGPFTDAGLLREIVKFIRRYYPVRNCKKDIERKNIRACTQYHIKRCSGPCEGRICKADYDRLVSGVKAFFSGRYKNFERELKKWLKEAVERHDFEEAIEIKKRLLMLDKMRGKFPLRREKELVFYSEAGVLKNLAEILHLERIPYAIEGFDVSNTAGLFATASKVLFKGGAPDRSGYRKYRIFFNDRIDDYRMISEVLERRFSSDKDKELPDLVLIDGGKGHLASAAHILKKMRIDIPVISLAKENEELFALPVKEPIKLAGNSPELHLLQRVRDEAHRFALSYHRRLRAKNIRESFFDSIEGVGEARKKKLMQMFPDIAFLSKADADQLERAGLPRKVALEVIKSAKQFTGGQNNEKEKVFS